MTLNGQQDIISEMKNILGENGKDGTSSPKTSTKKIISELQGILDETKQDVPSSPEVVSQDIISGLQGILDETKQDVSSSPEVVSQDIIIGLQTILDENGKEILSSPDALLKKLDAFGKISSMSKYQIRNAAELGILTRFYGVKTSEFSRIREKAIKDICEEYGTAQNVADEIVTIAQALKFQSASPIMIGVDYDSEQWKIAEAFKQIYSLKGREIYKERDLFLSMFKDLYPNFSPKVCRLIKVAIDCGAFSMVLEVTGNDEAVCASAVRKMADDYGISEAFATDLVKSIAWSIGKNPAARRA